MTQTDDSDIGIIPVSSLGEWGEKSYSPQCRTN